MFICLLTYNIAYATVTMLVRLKCLESFSMFLFAREKFYIVVIVMYKYFLLTTILNRLLKKYVVLTSDILLQLFISVSTV